MPSACLFESCYSDTINAQKGDNFTIGWANGYYTALEIRGQYHKFANVGTTFVKKTDKRLRLKINEVRHPFPFESRLASPTPESIAIALM